MRRQATIVRERIDSHYYSPRTADAIAFGVGVLFARLDFSDARKFASAVHYYAVFTGLLAYLFWLRHYLRLAGRAALEGFRPVYREVDRVSGRVVTLEDAPLLLSNSPAAATLGWSLAWMAMVAGLLALRVAPFQRLGVSTSTASFVFNTLLELAT